MVKKIERKDSMKNVLRKLLIFIAVVYTLTLTVLYARLEAQYTMYKQFNPPTVQTQVEQIPTINL